MTLNKKDFEWTLKHVTMLAVDGVLIKNGAVLMIKRSYNPYKGYWATPGGFVEYGERLEDAVVRETFEETGIRTKVKKMVGVYSEPKRNPRGHVVSICFLLQYVSGKITASDETSDVRFFKKLPNKIGADYKKMITDAKNAVRSK